MKAVLVLGLMLTSAVSFAERRFFQRGYSGGSNHSYQTPGTSYRSNQATRVNSYSQVQQSDASVSGQHGYNVGSRYDAYSGNRYLGGGAYGYAGGQTNYGSTWAQETEVAARNEQLAQTLGNFARSMSAFKPTMLHAHEAYRRGQMSRTEYQYLLQLEAYADLAGSAYTTFLQTNSPSTKASAMADIKRGLRGVIAVIRGLDRDLGVPAHILRQYEEGLFRYEAYLN